MEPEKQTGNKEIYSGDVRHLYTEKYFLENATGYAEFKEFKGEFGQLIDKFKFSIKCLNLLQTDRLLDIGCGRGEVVIYHSLNGGDATGVDFSEDAINLAKVKAAELKVSCCFRIDTFTNIPEEKKFDKIISIDFIEHISLKESKMFLRKCYNLLKPGGRLVVHTYPNTLRRKIGYKLIRIFSIMKNKPLPVKEPDTISDHYKQYHLNEQNYFSLKKLASDEKFSKVKLLYFDPGIKDSTFKSVLYYTPFRHFFLKGLTMIADK